MTMCANTRSRHVGAQRRAARRGGPRARVDAERLTANPADLRTVHAAYARLELALAS